MPKVFLKKLVFISALILIVLLLSIFLWDFFAEPPEKILTNLKFFQAALLSEPEPDVVFQEQDFSGGEAHQPDEPEESKNELVSDPSIKSVQDQLDDIAEKIDIIERQISDLRTADLISSLASSSESEIPKFDEQEAEPQKEIQLAVQPTVESKPKITGSGGKPNYPKILISEVQISSEDDEKQEFIELYNPNEKGIDLTGWYLQKKTEKGKNWSTFASKNLFNGKSISGNGYFLIARVDYYLGLADIFTDNSITEDNSFALKNPNGEISDKLGFGNAQDPELLASITPGNGQSIGRKLFDDLPAQAGGFERDTDNNFFDFELQTPTPKMSNLTYVAPVEPPAPVLENILLNEIQIEGETVKDDWVELYNPNDVDVDISAYKLRKRTSEGGESSIRVFPAGSIIFAKGYYLWASSADEDFPLLAGADTWTKQNIAENNSIALLTSDDVILSALAWGVSENPFVEGAAFLDNPVANQSLGRVWSEEAGEYKNIGDNSADFEVQTPTPKQKNTAWVEPPPAPQDTTPPEVIFMLEAIQNSLNFTIDFEITDPLDTVTPSGLASYIFQWREGEWPCQAEALCEGWQEDPEQEILRAPSSQNFKGGREFEGENGKTYFFQITARDLLDNNSGWMPKIPAITTVSASDSPVINPAFSHVVINEVQIAGETTKDEFIELYNPNEFDVDISGYALKKKTSGGAESNLVSAGFFSGAIPALGYFLIVPQANDDETPNYTGDSVPNLHYSGKTYSIASNNTVLLYDNEGDLIDKLGFGEAQDYETLPAQNPLAGQSITRTSGADTDDNSADFTISDAPSPGS